MSLSVLLYRPQFLKDKALGWGYFCRKENHAIEKDTVPQVIDLSLPQIKQLLLLSPFLSPVQKGKSHHKATKVSFNSDFVLVGSFPASVIVSLDWQFDLIRGHLGETSLGMAEVIAGMA